MGKDRPPDLKRYMRVRRLFLQALEHGQRTGLTSAWLDLALDCENPRVSRLWSGRIGTATLTYEVELSVRCRKCPKCAWRKTMFWSHRALEEIRLAPRTWWSTYTLRPDIHAECTARARLLVGGTPFDERSPDEQFIIRYGMLVRRVTNMIKRLRKGAAGRPPVRFRYLVVCEAHTGKHNERLGLESGQNLGMPHFHAFWHEVSPLNQLRKHRHLEAVWPFGIMSHSIVDKDAEEVRERAIYLAKYIAKGNLGRVHCSLKYGDPEAIRREHLSCDLDDFSDIPLFLQNVETNLRSNNIVPSTGNNVYPKQND